MVDLLFYISIVHVFCTKSTYCADLREDKYYLSDHPGLVPVTTAQVWLNSTFIIHTRLFWASLDYHIWHLLFLICWWLYIHMWWMSQGPAFDGSSISSSLSAWVRKLGLSNEMLVFGGGRLGESVDWCTCVSYYRGAANNLKQVKNNLFLLLHFAARFYENFISLWLVLLKILILVDVIVRERNSESRLVLLIMLNAAQKRNRYLWNNSNSVDLNASSIYWTTGIIMLQLLFSLFLIQCQNFTQSAECQSRVRCCNQGSYSTTTEAEGEEEKTTPWMFNPVSTSFWLLFLVYHTYSCDTFLVLLNIE